MFLQCLPLTEQEICFQQIHLIFQAVVRDSTSVKDLAKTENKIWDIVLLLPFLYLCLEF